MVTTQANLEAAYASSDVPEEKHVAVVRHISASLSQLGGELTDATAERNPTALGLVIDKVHEFVASLNAMADGVVMPQPPAPPWMDEEGDAEQNTAMAAKAPSHGPTHISPEQEKKAAAEAAAHPKPSSPHKEGMLEPNSGAAPAAAQGKK